MTILFYSMPTCGYCKRAMQLLSNELASKEIVLKSSQEAPKGVSGFPYFVNSVNNKTHTGLPSSKMELYSKLGVSGGGPQPAGDRGAMIIFYAMDGCGHCVNAKKTLAREIANGMISVRPHTEAVGASGFPAFKSVKTGKMSLGAPASFQDLLAKLDMGENFKVFPRLPDSHVGVR